MNTNIEQTTVDLLLRQYYNPTKENAKELEEATLKDEGQGLSVQGKILVNFHGISPSHLKEITKGECAQLQQDLIYEDHLNTYTRRLDTLYTRALSDKECRYKFKQLVIELRHHNIPYPQVKHLTINAIGWMRGNKIPSHSILDVINKDT